MCHSAYSRNSSTPKVCCCEAICPALSNEKTNGGWMLNHRGCCTTEVFSVTQHHSTKLSFWILFIYFSEKVLPAKKKQTLYWILIRSYPPALRPAGNTALLVPTSGCIIQHGDGDVRVVQDTTYRVSELCLWEDSTKIYYTWYVSAGSTHKKVKVHQTSSSTYGSRFVAQVSSEYTEKAT